VLSRIARHGSVSEMRTLQMQRVVAHHGSVSEMHTLQMQRVVAHHAPWQHQKHKCSVLSLRNLKNINGACRT